MLSVNDLIDINYIPTEEEISLKLLAEFYEEYLCKRIFVFTLKNGKVIKLFFRDGTEIFHVSGIDHIYVGVPMDGRRFLQGIKNKEIDLKVVENVNTAAYKDYVIRIRSMACIDTIIKNCEYLWYPEGKIPESKIEVKYLLLKGLDEKNLHLGIDTYNENRPYFSRTLLVTEGNNADKFIGKADERLRVAKLEIRDKDTNEMLVCVEREKAEKKALEEIRKCAEKWYSDKFSTLLSAYLLEVVNQNAYENWINGLDYDIVSKLSFVDEDIAAALEIEKELKDKQEWMELVLGIFEEKISDPKLVDKLLSLSIGGFREYEKSLVGSIKREIRDGWKRDLKEIFNINKVDIRRTIEKLDCYSSGRIVGEAIKRYEKEELSTNMMVHINKNIAGMCEKIIHTILVNEICKNREDVLKKLISLIVYKI